MENQSRNNFLILLIIILLSAVSIAALNKINQMEKEMNGMKQKYNTVLNQIKITQNNLLENGLYEDNSSIITDISIDLFESYSVKNNNIGIPAYGPITNFSVLRNEELSGINIISQDENITLLSAEVSLPNWVLEMKNDDIIFVNEMTSVLIECPLLINPYENSAQNTILMYSTPVKKLITYNDWVYVESLVKRDANILYKGWVKKKNLGFIETTNTMVDRFCYIEKGKDILVKGGKATAPMNQWGRILEEDQEYYTVVTLGSYTYKTKKDAVIFLEKKR